MDDRNDDLADTAGTAGADRSGTGNGRRRAGVQSVDRAFALLDVLGHAPTPLTVQEAARRAGLDRTVAHRLLKTLRGHDVVAEVRGTYRLGPQTVLMATRYTESLLVRRVAMPYMVDLQSRDLADSPFTVNLSIAVGDVTAVLERVWTQRAPLDLVLSSGDLFALERTATGRSILCHLSPEEVDAAIGRERHEQVRPALEQARHSGGVAVSDGEAIPGVRAMAAAIVSSQGKPVAAIGISSPEGSDQLVPGSALAQKLARTVSMVGKMLP